MYGASAWLQKTAIASALATFQVTMLVIKLHTLSTVTSFNWGIVLLPLWLALGIWFFYLGYLLLLYVGYRTKGSLPVQRVPPERLFLVVNVVMLLSITAFGAELAVELQTPGTIDMRLLFLPLYIGFPLVVLVAWVPYLHYKHRQEFSQMYGGPAAPPSALPITANYLPMDPAFAGSPLRASVDAYGGNSSFVIPIGSGVSQFNGTHEVRQ